MSKDKEDLAEDEGEEEAEEELPIEVEQPEGGIIYCFDTSALVYAFRYVYPPQAFVGLWHRLDGLAQNRRMMAPEEVRIELQDRGDWLTHWVLARPQIFARQDYRQQAFMSRISVDYPQLTRLTVTEQRADPWVVALAQTRGYIVVSAELREAKKIPKIPQMCQKYYIPHIPLLNVILAEGWQFH